MFLRSGRRALHSEEGKPAVLEKFPFWFGDCAGIYSVKQKTAILQFCKEKNFHCTCEEDRLPNCSNGPNCRKCVCDLCLGILDIYFPCVAECFDDDDEVKVPVAEIFKAAGLL